MIYLCPFCGRDLDRKLTEGITSCQNCGRVFDSSPFHRILSAAWAISRWHTNLEKIVEKYDLEPTEINVLNHYVVGLDYDHEQLLKTIKGDIILEAA
jgi:hypothetical protein